jgi:hypothetical protein
MSKIYTVNNGEAGKDQIPSVEYINELTKMVEDVLMSINKDFKGFSSIKTDNEELPIGVKEQPIVVATDIKTDSQHKFINDGILATMVDKPSKFEVEKMLDNNKEEIRKEINDIYTRIVNTPNVINKLRDISTILNEDEVISGLVNTLSYKTDKFDFDSHSDCYKHLDNNDRKALNILLKCLTGGFADWNAKEDSYNAIKNKPETLPANGGNADTIANYGINDIINKYGYDIVIGSSGEKYSKESCDIYAEDGDIGSDVFINLLKSLKDDGTILFKRGYYKLDFIDNYNFTIIFEGIDRRLVHIKANIINIHDSVFKHLTITDSIVHIGSGCEISNVAFINCEIIFNETTNSNIMGCKFCNCTFEYKGNLLNNIIKFNRYVQTKPITYIGGNNIISENI